MNKILKIVSMVLTMLVLLGGAIFGYGQLQARSINNTEDIGEVKVEIKEVKIDTTENSAVNREQAIILKQTAKILDGIEKRMK